MSTAVLRRSASSYGTEQVSSDTEQARAFYTRLFGWGSEVFEPSDRLRRCSRQADETLGAASARPGKERRPALVEPRAGENVDETIETAKSAGGRRGGSVRADEGRTMAIIADPQGAYISAYQPEGDGTGPEGRLRPGTSSRIDRRRRRAAFLRRSSAGQPGQMARVRRLSHLQPRGHRHCRADELSGPTVPPVGRHMSPSTTPTRRRRKQRTSGAPRSWSRSDVPKVGRIAVLRDPQGATSGSSSLTPLHSGAPPAGPPSCRRRPAGSPIE